MKGYRFDIVFLMLIISTCLYSQGIVVTRQECSDFYNKFNNKELKHTFYMESKTEFFDFCLDTNQIPKDSFFSEADIKFMLDQMHHPAIVGWNQKDIKNASIINEQELEQIFNSTNGGGWSDFYEKYNSNGYYNLAPPLFSVNKDRCVAYVSNYCGGLCGSGMMYFCQKKGTDWVIIRQYRCWIS